MERADGKNGGYIFKSGYDCGYDYDVFKFNPLNTWL
jgi:hypothetical protein